MSEISSSRIIGENDETGEYLQLKPDDAIIFTAIGNATMGTVQVTNVSVQYVSYKIKTTSPDKFRVRPSAGILSPGQTATVQVLLQQGNSLSAISEDKFLVMCMAISDEITTNERAVADLWKSIPHGSLQIENHKLLCSWPGDSYRKKQISRLNAGTVLSMDTERQVSHFNVTLSKLTETTQRLEQQLKLTQILQWLTLLLFLTLSGAFLYIFRHDLNLFGLAEYDKRTEL